VNHASTLVGALVGGTYRVERVVGAGATSVVLGARHERLEQPVAIKLLHGERARRESAAGRFVREARLAARATSPHLVRVFDAGVHQDAPFMVMELLEGRSLEAELERRGPLPVAEAVALVRDACRGIAELHARGIVHRDIKPANLFVACHEGRRTLKVLDLGISKDLDGIAPGAALTADRMILGTPDYMSPEQIEDARNVDARSDVWALGVVLHELVTGVLPFGKRTRSDATEVFRRVLSEAPRPPRVRVPALAGDLERIILRGLARERWARFQSVDDLADALDAFLEAPARPGPAVADPALSPTEPGRVVEREGTPTLEMTLPPGARRVIAPTQDDDVDDDVDDGEVAGLPRRLRGASLVAGIAAVAAGLVAGWCVLAL
jgi:serine/threonine-protein kinase